MPKVKTWTKKEIANQIAKKITWLSKMSLLIFNYKCPKGSEDVHPYIITKNGKGVASILPFIDSEEIKNITRRLLNNGVRIFSDFI